MSCMYKQPNKGRSARGNIDFWERLPLSIKACIQTLWKSVSIVKYADPVPLPSCFSLLCVYLSVFVFVSLFLTLWLSYCLHIPHRSSCCGQRTTLLLRFLENRMYRLGAATVGMGLFAIALDKAATFAWVCIFCFLQVRIRCGRIYDSDEVM